MMMFVILSDLFKGSELLKVKGKDASGMRVFDRTANFRGKYLLIGKKSGFVIKVNSLRKSGGYSQSPGPLPVFFTDAYPLVSKVEAASK